ncbi:MAG: 2'-5' RNA ligase family protein [Reyranella sp.]|nr:2'-5' RNA ligase family protein [Reyranella sp.]
MNDLFTTTSGTFQASHSLWGLQNRGPSQLALRRLRRRHAGLARATARGQASDRLFFAVRPDEETAGRIVERAERWRVDHGLTGRPLRPEHLHVTLCHVGDAAGPPPAELIEALAERAAAVPMPAFRVEFDRVMSFRNGAFVLCGDESVIGLEVLQQRLSDALDASPRPARRFVPHLTLLRDERRVAEQPIERIGWTAREVVLVHSLLGRTIHRHLLRLPLLSA